MTDPPSAPGLLTQFVNGALSFEAYSAALDTLLPARQRERMVFDYVVLSLDIEGRVLGGGWFTAPGHYAAARRARRRLTENAVIAGRQLLVVTEIGTQYLYLARPRTQDEKRAVIEALPIESEDGRGRWSRKAEVA